MSKNPLNRIDFIEPPQEIEIIVENNSLEKKDKLTQIVSPSDAKESSVEPNTNLLSDKNTKVEKQSLKRGDLPVANLSKPLKPMEKAEQLKNANPTKSNEIETRTKPTKSDLPEKKITDNRKALDSILESTMYEINKDIKNSQTKSESQLKQDKSENSAESRLNAMAGVSGNPDLITGIPDGEVTLLNAKADRFAVFVRRVALQVFSNLRNSNWYEMGNLTQGLKTEEITVRAILDRTGKLESFEMVESSKVEIFDKALNRSIKKGAWDKNPPPAALTPDGKIKFIFKAKAWVNGSPSGRSRQWVQLATGLE